MLVGVHVLKGRRSATRGQDGLSGATRLAVPDVSAVFNVPQNPDWGCVNLGVAAPLERALCDVAVITGNGCASGGVRGHE